MAGVSMKATVTMPRKVSALASAKPTKALADAVVGVLERGIMQVFRSQGTELGTPWQPLSDRTIARRRTGRRRAGSAQVLLDTGRLRASVTMHRGSGAHRVTTPMHVEVGTRLVYARTHQFGRDAIPARPFLGITPSARDACRELIRSQLIVGPLRGGGS